MILFNIKVHYKKYFLKFDINTKGIICKYLLLFAKSKRYITHDLFWIGEREYNFKSFLLSKYITFSNINLENLITNTTIVYENTL